MFGAGGSPVEEGGITAVRSAATLLRNPTEGYAREGGRMVFAEAAWKTPVSFPIQSWNRKAKPPPV